MRRVPRDRGEGRSRVPLWEAGLPARRPRPEPRPYVVCVLPETVAGGGVSSGRSSGVPSRDGEDSTCGNRAAWQVPVWK